MYMCMRYSCTDAFARCRCLLLEMFASVSPLLRRYTFVSLTPVLMLSSYCYMRLFLQIVFVPHVLVSYCNRKRLTWMYVTLITTKII